MDKKKKPVIKPISVRLTDEQQKDLAALSEKYGAPQALLIRWSIDALLALGDESDGLKLPLRFKGE